MSFFPSLPADAGVRHILTLNVEAGRALVALHFAALRHAGPLEALLADMDTADVNERLKPPLVAAKPGSRA